MEYGVYDRMIELRRLDASNVEEFRAIRLRALREHPDAYTHVYERENVTPLTLHAGMIRDHMIVGAFDNDELIGFTIMSFMNPLKFKHKARVWGAYVKPESRTSSIAKQMREWLFEKARGLGITQIQSSIVTTNEAALALHKGLGYIEAYTEKDGMEQSKDRFADVLHLVKYL